MKDVRDLREHVEPEDLPVIGKELLLAGDLTVEDRTVETIPIFRLELWEDSCRELVKLRFLGLRLGPSCVLEKLAGVGIAVVDDDSLLEDLDSFANPEVVGIDESSSVVDVRDILPFEEDSLRDS